MHANGAWFLAMLALAFALRTYALGGQSLWNDEGTSVALASRSLEAIADGAAKDIHPPLYYFLLHFWMPVTGDSEFAVRFLSVIAGVLLVAFTTRLARDLFGREAALVAGLLSALSPFLVYYSQETRMYIWVAMWCAVSVWAMVKWGFRFGSGLQSKIKNQKPKIQNLQSPIAAFHSSLTLYVAATIAALHTHYFAPAALVAENIAVAVWLALRWRRLRDPSAVTGSGPAVKYALAAWIAAQMVIGLAFLPWYLYAGGQLAAWPSISEPFDLPTLLWRVLSVFSTGLSLDGSAATITALMLGTLLVVGLLPGRKGPADLSPSPPSVAHPSPARRGEQTSPPAPLPAERHGAVSLQGEGSRNTPSLVGNRTGVRWADALPGDSAPAGLGIALLWLWLLIPIAAVYIVSLSRPAYNPKFLLLATPPFFILVARGLSVLGERMPVVLRSAGHLPTPAYSLLGVAILAVAGLLPSLRNYYTEPRFARDNYRAIMHYIDTRARAGDGLLIDAPGQSDVVRYYLHGDVRLFPLPNGRPPDPTRTRADVDGMISQVDRLFAIYWATEQADPERIIETRLAEQAFKARDDWHGNVRLAVYGTPPVARRPSRVINAEFGGDILLAGYQLDAEQLRAGDVETLTLYWTTKQTLAARYKIFVHLLDDASRVVAQRDGEPVADLRLTTTWRPGETIADNYGVVIEPETPPGEYRVEIGMYRADTGARLPIVGNDGQAMGDSLILDRVKVSR